MAMYIVFLGIIPVAAIVAFLLYYTRYNVNFKWQKTSAAYVLSNCLKHVNCACCCPCTRDKPTVPTVSHRVDNAKPATTRLRNIDIKPTGLISTTNTQILNNCASCSNDNLVLPESQKRRMSLKTIKNLKINTNFKLKPKSDNITLATIQTDDEDSGLKFVSVKNLSKQFQTGNHSGGKC